MQIFTGTDTAPYTRSPVAAWARAHLEPRLHGKVHELSALPLEPYGTSRLLRTGVVELVYQQCFGKLQDPSVARDKAEGLLRVAWCGTC